ncbi:5-aminolevulic acid synthase [Jannaschia ovalis]|uniref:5-aminolevulic acid synthase n=1 Tax=Jannaschia ovalis TaxID=3038773 RepID=A0ABY8LAG1_9RHOB|nr:5-aminolevulic acid synthase [Jannaschia sp. GRR-S6-38]WGH78327.1 5-aminolevulic acid synthase [Jannaschia sp. GRR-S6-38]
MIRFAFFALALAMPAAAQQVPDRAAAERELFGARNSDLVILRQPFLSDTDLATLQQMPKLAQLTYYGALAAAPSEGLQSEATRGAFNYHSIAAARAAALRDCDRARAAGAACAIVAEIRPRRFRDGRSLTLSQAATRALTGRDWRRAGRDAALAISPSSGAWGLGAGPAAAIAACGVADCTLAVAD